MLVDDALRLLPSGGKDVVSGVSHNIRTPLTTLLGIQDIVNGGMQLAEPDRESFLRIVLFESARLRRFAEMLTWYNDMVKGSFMIHPFTGDVRETLLRAVRTFDPEVRAKNVRIVVDLFPEKLPILGDHDRLKHAFEQLILNGIHVSPKAGEVRVGFVRNEGSVRVSFMNTGPILSPDECNFIFEPFMRVSHANDTGSELGLGLTVVRSIIHAHGGTIETAPFSPVGMSFTVDIPSV